MRNDTTESKGGDDGDGSSGGACPVGGMPRGCGRCKEANLLVGELAVVLGMSRTGVWKWRKRGVIEGKENGERNWVFNWGEVAEGIRKYWGNAGKYLVVQAEERMRNGILGGCPREPRAKRARAVKKRNGKATKKGKGKK